jgi:toxin CptA
MTSAPAIGFEYRPSRWLRRLPEAAAALALVAVASCGLGGWLKAPLAAAVALGAVRAWRAAGRSPVRAAGWGEGGWSLRLDSGEDVPARQASARVFGGAVLLRLAAPGRRPWTLLLAADNLDADTRRRLRMRLAVEQGEAAAEARPLPARRRAS